MNNVFIIATVRLQRPKPHKTFNDTVFVGEQYKMVYSRRNQQRNRYSLTDMNLFSLSVHVSVTFVYCQLLPRRLVNFSQIGLYQ